MAAGGLPELDVARVQRWCAGQVPEHVQSDIRVECDFAAGYLTICECRPPWREDFGHDWTRFPIARLHYTKTTGCGHCIGATGTSNTTAMTGWSPAPRSKTSSTTSTAEQTPSFEDDRRLIWPT